MRHYSALSGSRRGNPVAVVLPLAFILVQERLVGRVGKVVRQSSFARRGVLPEKKIKKWYDAEGDTKL